MRTSVSRRGVKGGKRPDTNQMKDWLAKGQAVTYLGVVRKFPGESSHYEISTEDGRLEVLVDVELIPSSTRVLCRLGFGGDQIYRIPRVDTEVAVICPYEPQSLIKDPLDYEGIIVAVLDTSVPGDLTDENTIILKANKILAYDGSGAVPLALKSDVDALASIFSTHTHTGVTTGPGVTGVTSATTPTATGTTIFKAK